MLTFSHTDKNWGLNAVFLKSMQALAARAFPLENAEFQGEPLAMQVQVFPPIALVLTVAAW